MILTGRYGEVWYAPAPSPGTLAKIASINTFKLDSKADYEDVTCFGDTNKVYIPGLIDMSGSFAGFWNSADLTLFEAAVATEPGTLKLVPNNTEPLFYWTGLAYLDASIECTLQAPKVTGTFKAAASWTGPEQVSTLGRGGDATRVQHAA
jgi:hypothetical protein